MSEEIKKYLGIEGAQALKVALEAEMDAKDEAIKSLLTGDGGDKIVVDEANKATYDGENNEISVIYETKEDAESKLNTANEYTDTKFNNVVGTVPENSTVMSIITNIQDNAYDDAAIQERLKEIEAFFHLAEGEQLDTALDTLKEIQTYITSEGAAADQMVLDIAANAQAIADEKARAEEAEGDIDAAYKAADEALDGRIAILEEIDHSAYMLKSSEITADEVNGWFGSTQA